MADGLSLHDQLRAAYDEHSGDDIETPEVAAPGGNGAQGAPTAEAAGAAPPFAAVGKTSAADPLAQAAADEGRPRGPDGKFLSKTDTVAEGASAQPQPIPTETATPADAGPQTPETTRIPPSLSAAVKSQWSDLPQVVRDEFSRLEGTFTKGKAEWEGKGQRLNRFEEIIGPQLPNWEMKGLDAFSGIQSLIAAQSVLDRNPVDGLVQIARSYGLTPAHLAQAFGLSQANGQAPGADGHQLATGAPDFTAALQQAMNPVLTQVQTLQQQINQERQQTQAVAVATLAKQIEDFAAKPENLYFDNVSDEVVARARQLAGNGPVTMDMVAKAYDAAVWADPSIRPHLLKSQADAQGSEDRRKADEVKKAAEAAARSKAQSARQAGVSVTGSPSPGSAPPAGAHGTVRESLMAAMQEHSGV